jgi:NAD(P)-dependent dehydrogenase (short-subunit alcohol dehydrogenase family)
MKKAILITGATRRLGLLFAQESLGRGFAVVAHYRSSRGPLSRWLRNHPEHARDVHFIRQELRDDTAALIDEAADLPVRLVGLVNNASIFTPGDLDDPHHFQQILQVNACIPLQLAARFCQRVRDGWIINITDAHIHGPNKRFQNYRISKRLLEMLTEQLAFLHAPRIRVNAIAPGAMLPSPGSSRGELAALSKSIPLERTGDTEALRQAFGYLLSNTYVTGQTLFVDGGWHLCR